jgi:hypothetical protein
MLCLEAEIHLTQVPLLSAESYSSQRPIFFSPHARTSISGAPVVLISDIRTVAATPRQPAGRSFNVCNYSALMPASLITLPHLTISDLTVAADCSGELPTVSNPVLRNFSLISAWARTLKVSWFNRVMIA